MRARAVRRPSCDHPKLSRTFCLMSQDIELLREMRDLLRVLAEPGLAKRDRKARETLKKLVGKSKPRGAAILLMDGTRSQAAIKAEAGIDAGELSRCVKALREAG